MSIIETKFFKERVETPILITNEVKSQKLSGDVIIQGYSLHDVLFTDQMTQKKIDISELLEQSNIKYNAQQIYSFYMGVTDYRGKAIKSIHLRRDGNNGNAISRTNEVYLYADCYDENGNLVDTIFSENKEMQAGSDMVTTWNFNPHIYIHDYYKQIKFYCSKVKGERQFQNTSTRVNIRSQSIRYRVQPQGKPNENPMPSEDWKTYDQAQQKAFTTDFAFTLMVKQLGFVKHIQDDILHLTDTKNELINSIPSISQELSSHITNQEVHVTTEQKESLRTLVLLQTSYNAHKNNKTIHISEEERKKWNQKFDERDIEEYLNVPTLQFSTLKEGFVSHDKGMGEAYYVQLSRQHFTTGKIQEIHIPYKAGKNKTSYLCAQIYNQGDDENTVKQLNDCVFSTNTQSQPQGTEGVSIFEFDNLILPQNYRFVRFIFTENNTQLPDISSRANIIGMRIRVITQSSNQQGWQDWDDDDCKILGSDNVEYNWYGYVQAVGIKHAYVVTNDEKEIIASVPSISTSLTSHIRSNASHVTEQEKTNWNDHIADNDIHVTAAEKEKWNSIEVPQPIIYTSGDNISINSDNVISVVTTNDITKSNKIPTTKAIYDELYETIIFNNKNSLATSPDSIGTAVLSRKHFIQGIIDKIIIPHDNNTQSTNQGGYLVIQTFDESNNQLSIDYSIEQQIYDTSKSKYEFTFDNVILPQNYSKVHLSIVQDKSTIPAIDSTNNKQFRVNCLTKSNDKDEVIVFEQDDDCRVYWRTDTDNVLPNGGNYIINFEVEYHKNKFSQQVIKENDILDKVFDYEKIDEIKYSTTDYIPQGLSETEDSCQKIQITLDESIKQNNVKLSKVGLVRHNTNGSYNTRYYLTIRAWDKTTNQVYKFYSTDSHYQSQGKIVEWNFDNVNFTDNLKDEIVIGFVTAPNDSNDFVGGTPIRIGTWTNSGSKWYKENWKVSWNNSWQNITPDVILKFDKINPSINSQFDEIKDDIRTINENISSHFMSNGHLSQDDITEIAKISSLENSINNHIGDSSHLTDEQIDAIERINSIEANAGQIAPLTAIVNNHIGDASHLTDIQKTEIDKISTISSQISEHIGTMDVHVTVDDKNKWNSIETIDNETKNNISQLISALLMPKTSNFTTVRDGYVTPNAGKATITCAQLTKKHFTTGRIKSIEIPYYGGTGTEGYLCVQFIGIEEDIDTVEKTFEDCYYSNEKMTQSGDGTAVFTFDNLVTPVDYKVVRFMIVADKNTVPNGRNGTNCLSWRARFMSPADNTGNYTTFDTDDCNIYNGSTFNNYVIYTNGVRVSTFVDEVTTDLILDMKNKIDELEQRISSLQNS